MSAAESAYLIFSCPFFDWSARKRLARNNKYYPVDTALRRVSVALTGADRGKLLECAVFLGLTQQELADLVGVGVRFVSEVERGKGTAEIDRVIELLRGVGIDIFLRARGGEL